jgi:SPP1 gp7 family putative phage head morphogenesis protein
MGVLANPWLPDGKTYGNRIRSNTQYLAEKMEVALEEALSKGWSVNRTARHIQETANEGFYNAVRLARTELNRAAAQGANHIYMQNADILDGKRWNATLDARTAPKDAQNDGKVFELSYDTPENPGKAGQRIPNHPNCRCKWTPILSALGISTKERIARGEGDSKTEFGERIYTNARTYKEYAKERGLPDLSEKLRNDKPSSYLRRGEKVYNESNKRNIPLLPNFDRAVIPEANLLGYALNKDHPTGKDKAAAFEKALGYTSANYTDLIKNVRDNLDKFPAESKGSNDYGERYQAILSLTGPNGKTANVLTAWIIRTNEELPQLTTIHVDKKKGAKDNDN